MLRKGRPTCCSPPGSWREKCGGRSKKKKMYSRLLWPSRRAVLKKVLSNLQRLCGTVWRAAKPAVNIQRHDIINPVVGAEIRRRSLVLCHAGGSGHLWWQLGRIRHKRHCKKNINSEKRLTWHWDDDERFLCAELSEQAPEVPALTERVSRLKRRRLGWEDEPMRQAANLSSYVMLKFHRKNQQFIPKFWSRTGALYQFHLR